MDHLASCYFCGTALDEPLQDYRVVPAELDEDATTTATLCAACHGKLERLLAPAVEAAGGQSATLETAGTHGESARSPDESASSQAGSASSQGGSAASVADDAEPTEDETDASAEGETGDREGTVGTEEPDDPEESDSIEDSDDPEESEPSVEAAGDDSGADGLVDLSGDDDEVAIEDDADEDDADEDDADEDDADEDLEESMEPDVPDPLQAADSQQDASAEANAEGDEEGDTGETAQASGAAGETETQTDQGEADTPTEEGQADTPTDEGEADTPTDEGEADTPTDESEEDGTVDEEGEDETGSEGRTIAEDDAGTGPRTTISALEYNKVMRLLQNREFPVDRAEIQTVAANAYGLAESECAQVIDLAIDRGLIDEEGDQLVRPD